MGGAARAWGVVIAASLLVSGGCGDDEGPASGTTTAAGSSSDGAGPAGSESSDEPGVCVPGQSRACYEGPPGTEGVGACAAGQAVCTEDGQGWSACAGQVEPAPAERCETPEDDDCDGLSLCEPTLEWWQLLPRWVTHVAPGAAGGVIAVGMEGNVGFDEQQGALFVRVLDAAGRLLWERNAEPTWYQWPSVVAADGAGGLVVAGTYEGAPDFGGGPLPEAGYQAFAVRYQSDGAHVWSHAIASDGYYGAALGSDGTTYLAGGYLYANVGGSLVQGDFYVVAIDDSGTPTWILPGQGTGSSEGMVALVLTEADELVLVVAPNGLELTLGELSIPVDGIQPVLVRIGLDGTPLGYERLLDAPVAVVGGLRAFARPGGLMTVASMWQIIDDAYVSGVYMVGMDTALAPVSQHVVEGQSLWLQATARHPDGNTLLALQFSGLLELGPLGVGAQGGTYGSAITVVDDEGDARWAEVIYPTSYVEVPSIAAATDGSVYIAAVVDEGTVLDGEVFDGSVFDGVVLAKLRP